MVPINRCKAKKGRSVGSGLRGGPLPKSPSTTSPDSNETSSLDYQHGGLDLGYNRARKYQTCSDSVFDLKPTKACELTHRDWFLLVSYIGDSAVATDAASATYSSFGINDTGATFSISQRQEESPTNTSGTSQVTASDPHTYPESPLSQSTSMRK